MNIENVLNKSLKSKLFLIALLGILLTGFLMKDYDEIKDFPINVSAHTINSDNLISGLAYKISLNGTHITIADGSTWGWLYNIQAIRQQAGFH
ncbi:MAG: hypothetical protein HeimC2_18030 [Candidatus Heimdallarchaeota archaeon LC_2]|nr:MAG: hypothetical protein HeimC2_18030 [Candidatus Heimdallarchaeota archaeon LC_2]